MRLVYGTKQTRPGAVACPFSAPLISAVPLFEHSGSTIVRTAHHLDVDDIVYCRRMTEFAQPNRLWKAGIVKLGTSTRQ